MLKIADIVEYMQNNFIDYKFYNNFLPRDVKQCISIFKGNYNKPNTAIGSIANTTYMTLSATFLIHWSESSNSCEDIAKEMYQFFFKKSRFTVNGTEVITVELIDGSPTEFFRDSKNICETIIKSRWYYNV